MVRSLCGLVALLLVFKAIRSVRLALQVNTSDGRATGSRRPLRVLYDMAAMVKP